MILPTDGSLFAEMVATAAMLSSTDCDIDLISATTTSMPFCMPRTSAFASTPAATCRSPALNSASARMVAVVVPSPASSEVLEAASLTSCAPMFSALLRNSSSSATVTPSLVTVGPPHDLSSTAFRPRGPSVDFTAAESFLKPDSRAVRASASKASSFTAIRACLLRVVDFGGLGWFQRLGPSAEFTVQRSRNQCVTDETSLRHVPATFLQPRRRGAPPPGLSELTTAVNQVCQGGRTHAP